MKKILYIANVRIPTEKAHGIQIMKMCEAFGNQNYETELLAPTRHNPKMFGVDPFQYYEVKKNFQIRHLCAFDPFWLMQLPQGIYIKFQAFFFSISLYFHLRRVKDRDNYIVYVRDEYLLPVLQRLFKTVVWEAHNLPQNRARYSEIWKRCAGIVAISNGLKRDLVKLGIDEGNIMVAPDGVDLQKFSAGGGSAFGGQIRGELGLPVDKQIVMYTGHLYEWKGAQTLLRAAAFLSLRAPLLDGAKQSQGNTTLPEADRDDGNLLFVFVGGTDQDIEKFREIAKDADNILILGHKPYGEISKYLAAADVLVLPNSAKSEISRSYTSPLKQFEYMAAGKPIVASSLPSIREILDENSAIFFEPDNAADLAGKIDLAISDKNLSEKVASNAAQIVKKYTWDMRAERIVDFLG
ncbi:glycosyltransferase [bacterium]|nr:MAG: glycosyltransferase [bacterium]